MSDEPQVYTDTNRTILLTVRADGTHELALRDEHRRWLPPVRLQPEPIEVRATPTPAEIIAAAEDHAEAERRARLAAVLSRWSK